MVEQLVNTSHAVYTEAIYYLHTDHLNTPQRITNAQQQVIWQWQGDAFGDGKEIADPDGDGKKFWFPLRFPGQYYDGETGLNYNYYRDYDRQLGRYVQSDPIGLQGGLNTYGYVGGNPLTYIDPDGLTWTWVLPPRPILVPRPKPMPSSPAKPIDLPIPGIDSYPWPGSPNKDPFGEHCRSLAEGLPILVPPVM